MNNSIKAVKAVLAQSDLTATNFQDCASHGADGGVSGFIYYAETTSFYDANEELINDMLEESLNDIYDEGTTILQMIQGFGRGGDVEIEEIDLVFDEDLEEWESVSESDFENDFENEVVHTATDYYNMTEKGIVKDTAYKNLMAWFVLEEASHYISNLLEDGDVEEVKALEVDCEEWEEYNK